MNRSRTLLKNINASEQEYVCIDESAEAAISRLSKEKTYKQSKLPMIWRIRANNWNFYYQAHQLFFPTNVARNVGRLGSKTFFVFTADIELYPNPGLANDFIQMIMRYNISKEDLIDKPRLSQ